MEGGGGGTRLGSRSSTRHGPTSVFSGPVRRWKKTWAPIHSSNPSPVASRILLRKWVPLVTGGKDETSEELSLRPIRYLPVSVVLAQRKEAVRKASEQAEAAAKAILATQENINVLENKAIHTISLDSTNCELTKDHDTKALAAGVLPFDQTAGKGLKEGKSTADSLEKADKNEHIVVEATSEELKASSAYAEMQQDCKAEAGQYSAMEDEIVMLSESSAESESEEGG